MNRIFDLIEKLGLVFLTLGIVTFVLLASKFWAADTQLFFFLVGDYQAFILLSIGLLVFGYVMKKLLVWEIHSALGPKKRRRR